ncbi:MAG: GMC family oxidoreductase [Planctomycetes bacterium]|nr:GMC family oxidoreductase [Planctomycetota bacterium]
MPDPDVIVVGAGAGGLAAAWRLTTQGARVVLLEGGRAYTPSKDYPQSADHYERLAFPYDPEFDRAGRPRYGYGEAQVLPAALDAYRSHDAAHGRLVPGRARRYAQYSHVRGVGGTTLHFQGESHRYHPDALRMRSALGVGVDWPLGFAELERYYDVAEAQLGVAAPASIPERPRSAQPLPAHTLGYASQVLAPAFRSVGTTLVPNSLAVLSVPRAGRPACNYCNSCTQGCPLGDKGSADVAFLPAALATGRLEVRANAQVLLIERGPQGRASGVIYVDAKGAEQVARAEVVLLACGAIETPRLLLNSGGLANGSGQVGRHLTETLLWTSVGLLEERVDAHRGLPIDGSAWTFAIPERRPEGYVGGFRLATSHGMAGLRGPAFYAEFLAPGFGLEHQRRVAEIVGRGVAVSAIGEWLPNSGTYVDLDPSRKDVFGRPVARIHSRLEANELTCLKHMADTVRAILAAAKAEIVSEVTTLDQFMATHVLGTCRLGEDPATSVADPDGFSHEVPNLGFADGSAVPSSGSGDSPSLTISALAIRTADKALARAARGPR